MGDVISLNDWRRAGTGSWTPASPEGQVHRAPAFFFDLGCPFSYLAAERVERLLGSVAWIPTSSVALHRGSRWSDARASALARLRAEERARELRLPLVWPERFPAGVPMALRAAAHAAQLGAGAEFALAAVRLAYCGGFDLEDPETLAEAAAAAGMTLEQCLGAAGDLAHDGALNATARSLMRCGVRELPAVRVAGRYIAGERHLPEAAALLRSVSHSHRLAPVG